jgi:hypothetical protein
MPTHNVKNCKKTIPAEYKIGNIVINGVRFAAASPLGRSGDCGLCDSVGQRAACA